MCRTARHSRIPPIDKRVNIERIGLADSPSRPTSRHLAHGTNATATAQCAVAASLLLLAGVPFAFGEGLRYGFYLADATRQSGLDFVHSGGRSKTMLLTDTIGSGGTLFDADGDGDLDLYLVSGTRLDASSPGPFRSRLYLNDGSGRFHRAGKRAGADLAGFGMGAISFDYDGDRDQDIYVTTRGANVLLRNRGDGTFVDATKVAGVGSTLWSSGATAGDYDRDGDLDLFVANYLDYDPRHHRILKFGPFRLAAGPQFFEGQGDRLYENQGDGTFRDVTAKAGVAGEPGKGLGTSFVDLDMDGWPDLIVANDTTPDYLYRNLGNRTFQDVAFEAGVAVGPYGVAESGMGLAIGDVNGDLLPDYMVTNFAIEQNGLFINEGSLVFRRATSESGLAPPRDVAVGFGADFVDLDNDGLLDLLIANGHISVDAARFPPFPQEYKQRPQLFLGKLDGRFSEAGRRAGAAFDRPIVGRGTICGDIDNDGDIDCVILTVDGPAVLLQNTAPPGCARPGNFLSVALRGRSPNTGAVGAVVRLLAGGRWQLGLSRCGTSYLSDSDPRLHFGLGHAPIVDEVDIIWPSGARTALRNVRPNQILTIDEP